VACKPSQREDASTVSVNHLLTDHKGVTKMRKVMLVVVAVMFMLILTTPAFAQTAAPATTNAFPWGYALAMAIASGLCALGQGKATASAAEALARNPGARAGIQFALILGLALIESLALYTLVIIFAK
jgi:F-type H+-transporting ATPase subunit c